MVINPPKKTLNFMILLLALIIGFVGYTLSRPGYFDPDTNMTRHLLTLVTILLGFAVSKQIFRLIKGGPSMVVEENGVFLYTNFLYGKLFLPWEYIKGIHPVTYRSPREITYRSLKLVPTDYGEFLKGFSFSRQILIRLANLGAGKAIDIPQLILDKKIEEIITAIEQVNVDQLKKIQIIEEKK